jgi:arsenical pump membrane protein
LPSRYSITTLVYLVGTAVTVFLSNDATAVVLTPAVYAAVKKAGTKALPYLLICAFIANAASFVLPISNPAACCSPARVFAICGALPAS